MGRHPMICENLPCGGTNSVVLDYARRLIRAYDICPSIGQFFADDVKNISYCRSMPEPLYKGSYSGFLS